MHADGALLALEALSVRLPAPGGAVLAVDRVTLALAAGGSLGIVGESGAGKSQLALAIPGLSPAGAEVSGSLAVAGVEVVGASAATLRRLRGATVGFVFQEPLAALTPHLTVGEQLAEALRAHRRLDRASARRAALAMLERVRIPDPAARLRQYPHELSGGLGQRVMLGIALIAAPSLVILDEPTSALDASVAAGILALLATLRAELGMAMLLISHDLEVVAASCEQLAVLYAGRVVERGPAARLLTAPRHPYTEGLARASLTLETPLDGPLPTIPGAPPAAGRRGAGCAFAPRCARARARCRAEAPELAGDAGAAVACHFPLADGSG